MTEHTRANTDQQAAPYRDLPDRAVQLLHAAADGLDDGALAGQLFGVTDGARWAALLPSVLGQDARLVRSDGRWRLAGASGAPPISRSQPAVNSVAPGVCVGDVSTRMVTLALGTSGADPRRHRILHVAAVRYESSTVTARIDTPICPEDAPTSRGRTGTRLAADSAEGPAIEDVLPQLAMLADNRPIYVYGARRAEAFLRAACARASMPLPHLALVEADDLLRTLLPVGRKPGLRAAASELGIPYPRPGVPISDAETLARALDRLRQRQQASPTRHDLHLDHPADSRTPELPSVPAEQLPFTSAWLARIPEGPGVYLFEDASGRTLYVGKGRSLRRRLAAYVSKSPGAHRQLEALAVRTARVRTMSAPSDLEALLLEARLIREYRPDFNVSRASSPPLTIIRASLDDPSPRLQLVARSADDGARYFGPFETVRAARQARDVCRAIYPEAVARRRGDATVQRAAVVAACRLLSGQKSPSLELLRARMVDAAARGDQGELDRLRATLRAAKQLDMRPSLLAGLPPGAQLLVSEQVLDGVTRTHLLQDGARLVSVSWEINWLPSDPARLRELADAMLAAAETVGSAPSEGDAAAASTDIFAPTSQPDPGESALVMRWLVQTWSRLEVARVPPADDDR